MSLRMYHNPRCSKSRATLAILRERGLEPDIVDYLHMPPSAAEILVICNMLGMRPRTLARHKEAHDAGIAEALESASDAEAAGLLHANPGVIERPIVIADESRAVIGRPPENVLKLL